MTPNHAISVVSTTSRGAASFTPRSFRLPRSTVVPIRDAGPDPMARHDRGFELDGASV